MYAIKLVEKQRCFQKINMNHIRPNPFQPRKIFDNEELESLAASINTYGLIQPITVRKMGENNYELIAGERRFRASRLCKMTEIDAFVIEAGNNKSACLALIENVQRSDLHFFEEAMAIGELIKEHNLTQEQVSKSIGKKQSTVANKLRILKLPPKVRELIIKHELTERHARALLKLSEPHIQSLVVEHIYEKGLNVKKTEEYIDTIIYKDVPKKKMKFSKFICDNRVYINSVKSVYKFMVDRGVKAEFNYEEKEVNLCIYIKINKG